MVCQSCTVSLAENLTHQSETSSIVITVFDMLKTLNRRSRKRGAALSFVVTMQSPAFPFPLCLRGVERFAMRSVTSDGSCHAVASARYASSA